MTKHKYINQTATFVSSEQLKFLKQMDKWLSNEPWQSEVEVDIALQVRTLITKIEDKGTPSWVFVFRHWCILIQF